MIQYDSFSISTYEKSLNIDYVLILSEMAIDCRMAWLVFHILDSRHNAIGYNTILITARNEER